MTPEPRIRKDSHEPAYSQLASILIEQISTGTFRQGSKLPPESELKKIYAVSSMTVRRSINILIDKGMVHTIQGKGTYVKPFRLGEVMFGLNTFGNLFTEDVIVKIIQARIISANGEIAKKLNLSEGTKTIHIQRMISRKSEPVLYHQEYLVYDPSRPIVEAEMEVTSLKGLFSGEDKSDLKGGHLTIEAVALNEDDALKLKEECGSPAFRLSHIFLDYNETPVSWGWFLCSSRHLQFETTIGVL